MDHPARAASTEEDIPSAGAVNTASTDQHALSAPSVTSAMEAANETSASDDVTVHIKFLHREPLSLRFPPTTAIGNLKERVRIMHEQATTRPESSASAPLSAFPSVDESTLPSLRLIYKGKVLKDDQSLNSYGFVDQDTIHAVFSRPSQAQPQATDEPRATASNSSAPPPSATSTSEEETPYPDRVFVMDFEGDQTGTGPELSRFISSVVSSALQGNESLSATFRFFADAPDGSTSTEPTNAPATGPSQSTLASAPFTYPPSQPATPSTPVPEATSTLPQPSATSLLNEAAALRRQFPALELAPLSQPRELSTDLYNLGNAIREAGDTYLAIHRQLQFVATRLLQYHNLSETERAMLRSRIDRLVPLMSRVSVMSANTATQLMNTPYGNNAQATTPAAQPTVGPTAAPTAMPTGAPAASRQNLSSLLSNLFQVANTTQQLPGGTSNAVDASARFVSTLLPNIVGTVAALATSGDMRSPATPPPPAPMAQPSVHPVVGAVPAPTEAMPFQAFARKLQAALSSRSDREQVSSENLLRLAFPLVVEHLQAMHLIGVQQFMRLATQEVEVALINSHADRDLVYQQTDFRRSTLRLSLHEILRVSGPVDEHRFSIFTSVIKRTCSHLFAELCDSLPPTTAAEVTADVIVGLISTSTTANASFLARVSSEVIQFLTNRFSVRRASTEAE